MRYELEGWPKEYIDQDDFRPVRKVVVPWGVRFQEAAYLDDMEYPYAPGCKAYPVQIGIEPLGAQIGGSGPTATYADAVITLQYSSKRSTEGAITEWISPSEDNEPCAPINRYFSAEQQANNQMPGILRATCVFHHQRKKLAMVPATALNSAGCVNSGQVNSTILGVWFAAETLRIRVPHINRTWTTSGMTSYFVHQEFVFKSNGCLGWNSQFNPSTGQYQYVYDENGNRKYDYALSGVVLV